MHYRNLKFNFFIGLMLVLSGKALAADEPVMLDTSVIRANKELPKVMYMVPWQQQKEYRKTQRQRLKLHSLFGDTFDPVYPESAVQDTSEAE